MTMVAMVGPLAHAQTPDVLPEPAPDKSVELATGLTVGLPLVGLAVTYAGASGDLPTNPGLAVLGLAIMLVGPSAGHQYTGHVGTVGLATRGLAFATMYVGLSGYLSDESPHDRKVGKVVLGAGMAAFVGSIVYDVITARPEVGEWNRDHAITIAPTAIATPTGSSFGLGIGGRF